MTIHTGDCIEVMAAMEPDSVDAVVTDPPYGLEFMGKAWDKFDRHGAASFEETNSSGKPSTFLQSGKVASDGKVHGKAGTQGGRPYVNKPRWSTMGSQALLAFQAWCEAWGREALRVTKPGGYLLAFGGTRTHHRLVCGLEDAGWIIRDELDWIYASGFPKGKANLKPAHEPIVLARKPGPLRPLAIDECRIGIDGGTKAVNFGENRGDKYGGGNGKPTNDIEEIGAGRWPSNLLLSDPELFDQPNPYVVGSGAVSQSTPFEWAQDRQTEPTIYAGGKGIPFDKEAMEGGYGDSGGYSRFFTIPQGGIICEWCGVSIAGPSSDQPSPPGASAPSDVATSADGMPASTVNGASATTTALTGNGSSSAASRSTPSIPSEPQLATSPSESPSSPANGAAQSATSSGITTTTPSRWLCGSCAVDVTALSTLGVTPDGIGDSPAARGIYPSLLVVPKADRGDREPVLRGQLAVKEGGSTWGDVGPVDGNPRKPDNGHVTRRENAHPTVKPTDLMRHLVRLVTPQGGTVLDCFLGSGSTAIAAELEGFAWIGIEKEPEYVAIAEARLNGTQRGLGLDVPAPTRKQPTDKRVTEGRLNRSRTDEVIWKSYQPDPEEVA